MTVAQQTPATPDLLAPVIIPSSANSAIPLDPINSVSSIEREELIDSNKSDVDKLLRGRPGVTLTKSIRCGASILTLRGAGSSLGQLTLDDIPLYSILPLSANLDAYSPDLLQSVDVVRGAAAPRYGSFSLGGVIRMTTRDAREDGAFLHVQGGSYATHAESVGASLASDKYCLTGTFRHEDVYEQFSMADEGDGRHERDPFNGNLAAVRVVAKPSAGLSFNGSFYYARTSAAIDRAGFLPNGRLDVIDEANDFALAQTWVAQETAALKLNPHWTSRLQVGFTQESAHVRILNFTASNNTRLFLGRWRNEHTLLQQDRQHLKLTWGGEARDEWGDASSPVDQANQSRSQFGGFLDLEGRFGDWEWLAGMRADHYADRGTHPVYYLGLAWQAQENVRLRANGGEGYRVPSFHERFFPLVGNANLRPERSQAVDVGVDISLPEKRMQFSATGFFNRYRDLFTSSLDPSVGQFVLRNTARTHAYGLELEWMYTSWVTLTVGTNYTFTYSRDRDLARDVPMLPQHQGRIFAEWQPLE